MEGNCSFESYVPNGDALMHIHMRRKETKNIPKTKHPHSPPTFTKKSLRISGPSCRRSLTIIFLRFHAIILRLENNCILILFIPPKVDALGKRPMFRNHPEAQPVSATRRIHWDNTIATRELHAAWQWRRLYKLVQPPKISLSEWCHGASYMNLRNRYHLILGGFSSHPLEKY